jgi:hypothetical protein
MGTLTDGKFVDARAIERAAAEEAAKGTGYLEKVESVLDRVIEIGSKDMPRDFEDLMLALAKARNFAWAMRRFPVFDLSCLGMMRKETLKVRVGSSTFDPSAFEMALWVPVFAMSGISGYAMSVQWNPGSEDYILGVKIDPNLVRDNTEEINRKKNERNRWETVSVEAKPPTIPGPILTNVGRIGPRFEETALVWEAQWTATARVQDPFVLGRVGHKWFVLDHFDATKLEKYVLSEFCSKRS